MVFIMVCWGKAACASILRPFFGGIKQTEIAACQAPDDWQIVHAPIYPKFVAFGR
jgi:hypothetical protein